MTRAVFAGRTISTPNEHRAVTEQIDVLAAAYDAARADAIYAPTRALFALHHHMAAEIADCIAGIAALISVEVQSAWEGTAEMQREDSLSGWRGAR